MIKSKKTAMIFRVDASFDIGMGHLMRCIAFAQAVERTGLQAIFLVNQQTLNLTKHLADFTFLYYQVSDVSEENEHSSDTLEEQERLSNISAQYDIQLFILDGYHFSLVYRQQIKCYLAKLRVPLAIIDDNGGAQPNDLLAADIIINPTCMLQTIPNYTELAPSAKVYAGEDYRLLRSEFVNQPLIDYNQRSGIVLTMGGSDPLNYSQACLQVLEHMQVDEKITVLIGSGFKHKQTLIKQIDQLPNNFCYLYQADNIAKLFAHAKLVISAAGGTQFELYAMQTPAILLVSFDNQWRNSLVAEQQGWAKVLDFRQSFDVWQLQMALALIFDKLSRIKMQQAMLCSTVNGADNLVNQLI